MYIESFMVLAMFCPPSHYTEGSNCCVGTCDVTMFIYRGGDLEVFFEPLSKCTCRFIVVYGQLNYVIENKIQLSLSLTSQSLFGFVSWT